MTARHRAARGPQLARTAVASQIRRAGLPLAAGLALLVGCTSTSPSAPFRAPDVPTGALQLVAFDSCQAAMTGLRAAAKAAVGPYGFGGYGVAYGAEAGGAKRADAAAPPNAAGAPGAA